MEKFLDRIKMDLFKTEKILVYRCVAFYYAQPNEIYTQGKATDQLLKVHQQPNVGSLILVSLTKDNPAVIVLHRQRFAEKP